MLFGKVCIEEELWHCAFVCYFNVVSQFTHYRKRKNYAFCLKGFSTQNIDLASLGTSQETIALCFRSPTFAGSNALLSLSHCFALRLFLTFAPPPRHFFSILGSPIPPIPMKPEISVLPGYKNFRFVFIPYYWLFIFYRGDAGDWR